MKGIRIGHLTTCYHTAFIIMGSHWIEKKTGIKPDWKLFSTGPEMIKAFGRDELDLGYIGLPPTIIGIDSGISLKCIAGGHMEGTVLVAKGAPKTYEDIKSIKEVLRQLKGRTVGTPSRGSIHDVIMRTLLAEAGFQQIVTVKNYDSADMIILALEDDEVQAAAGTPALAEVAKFLGAKIILPPGLMWPHNPSYGIVATHRMIEGSVEFLKDFLVLHEEACNLMREDPALAARIVSRAVKIMDEKFILQVYKISPKYCASLPTEYTRSTMAFIPPLQKMCYITKTLTEKDVFHKTIIESAHNGPQHYDEPLRLS